MYLTKNLYIYPIHTIYIFNKLILNILIYNQKKLGSIPMKSIGNTPSFFILKETLILNIKQTYLYLINLIIFYSYY